MLPGGVLPSFRIRYAGAGLGPNDSAVTWFSDCGRLGYRIHVEVMAMDVSTVEIAIIKSDREESLAAIELIGAGSG